MAELHQRFIVYASRPEAEMALFFAAVLESLFMPAGADALQSSMTLVNTNRAFRYALIAAAGNVAGGIVAFMAGFMFFQTLGGALMRQYGVMPYYQFLQDIFANYNVLIVLAAGMATIPYRVVAVLSGFFTAALPAFVIASAASRGVRAFVVSWLLWRGGSRYQIWIDRYFQGLSTVLALGLLLFFVMMMLLLKTA